ncbi:MAG: hypothetical protein L3J52_00990 [Proteobacteria bacterium]|nr:hypothetical protein [Pseudomonadota bacterium]
MKKLIILFLFVSLTFTALAGKNYFAKPSEASGKLILNFNKTASALFAVTLVKINDNEVSPRANAVWLSPGSYQLRFRTTINQAYAGGSGFNMLKNRRKNLNMELSVTIEDGKTYYVGYDAKDANSDNWKPVVWKTK